MSSSSKVLSLVLLTVFSLVSCQREEDFAYEEGSTLPMVFQGGIVPYEDATVKSPQELPFWNGSTIYVRLEEDGKVLFGKAVYNEDTASWSFTYSGSLKGWNQVVSAKCYYLPETLSSSVAELTIDYTKPIFEATDATLTINGQCVTLSAYLRPKTGRLCLGRDLISTETRNVRFLSGLSWYSRFSLKDYTFTSTESEFEFGATSYNYLYGFFTQEYNHTLSIKYGSLNYSRTFDASSNVLKPGHSGYISFPTYAHHDGWTMENDLQTEKREFIINGVTFNMITVPGGTFFMGKDGYQTPVHQVTLDEYMIGETEVTQELWEAVMGNNPSYHQGEVNLPVECVSWLDAQAFIGRLNALVDGFHFHLPTEAEWEYAAKEAGYSNSTYCGSDNLNRVGWYSGNSSDMTHPVAQKEPNALGLYDMSGNVWEWCMECEYSYPSDSQTNPVGNAWGSPLTRGGAYTDSDYYSSIYNRHTDGATDRQINHGFRLALGGGSVAQPEMVDLGLPSGLKWASFNIGASRPSEMGYYFAWGETMPRSSFFWNNYKFLTFGGSGSNDISVYTLPDGNTSTVWYDNGVFIGDNKSVLEAKDDAATIMWGNDWRVPSPNDWQELFNACSFSWVENIDGIGCMRVIGPNGNSIYLSGAGYIWEDYSNDISSWCNYWSSALSSTEYAYYVYLTWANEYTLNTRVRVHGLPIRPVSGAGNNYGMELSTSQIYFGNAPVNDVSERVFQVKNTGYLPITVSLASDNSAFVVSPSSITIPAKQSMDFTVNFTPAEASSYSGTITVTPVEFATVGTISLNGTGINVAYETYNVGGVEFKMVPVPGGTFDMGMDAGRQVTLDDYYIGQTEVTQELWTAVMGSNPSSHTGLSHLPVENVSWFDAKVFIERLSDLTGEHFRLPTEAEWEYAARGGSIASHYTYSGGNDLETIAWYRTNSGDTTHPVKTKAPNYLGIYDMSGNVWEWCEGFYGDLPYGAVSNPRGKAYNDYSANFRGGSYNSIEDCAVTLRGDFLNASNTLTYLGFRLAMGGPSYLPEAIDMGTGVKWATFNLGAGAEGELGNYYAWAEALPKKAFVVETYSYGDGTSNSYGGVNCTKYCTADQLSTLLDEDDAASVSWGNGWRIPSPSEWQTLLENTTPTQEQINGVNGIRLTSNINGNSIFLPAAGYRFAWDWSGWGYSINSGSYYWTNHCFYSDYDGYADAVYLYYSDNTVCSSIRPRYEGCPIRPVHD